MRGIFIFLCNVANYTNTNDEKAIDCRDAIQELMATEADLWKQRFDLDQNFYENEMTWYNHEIDILDTMQSTMETRGRILSDKYYKKQLEDQREILRLQKEERDKLIKDLNAALSSGDIDVYSEGWYEMKSAIDDVCSSIEETEGEIADLGKSIRELRWDNFDYLLDTISAVNDEIEFLFDLLDEEKMFDKQGHITDQGYAGLGLYASSFNVYLQQAQKYAEEIKQVNKELAEDPYNKDIIDRQKDLYKAHQDAIKGANDQKEAIADLIEDGIKKQVESLKDLIDKYQDLMDEEKDQIDYAEKIAESQKEVNKLQKQLNAYERDDTEEGAAKRQQLRNQLQEAQKNLAQTEEERRISETKKLLTEASEKYEEVLNTRLDNIDKLIEEVITDVNGNSSSIVDTINEAADKVGYTISEPLTYAMNNIDTSFVTLSGIGSSIANGVQTIVDYLRTGEVLSNNESAQEIANHSNQHETTRTNAETANSTAVTNGVKNSASTTQSSQYGLFKQGWNQEGSNWFFINADGSKSKNTLQTIGGQTYHFDSNGYMDKNKWVSDGKVWRYFDGYGRMLTGWQEFDGKWAYLSPEDGGKLVKQWYYDKNQQAWYWFDDKGWMVKGGIFDTANGKKNFDGYGRLLNKNNAIAKTITGLKTGSSFVPKDDIYRLFEEGNEAIVTKTGTYRKLNMGDMVFNKQATDNLYAMANDPASFIKNWSKADMVKGVSAVGVNNQNNITMQFNLPNVQNATQFINEMKSNNQFVKWLQEVTLGRAVGHNTLLANGIRF